MGLKTEIISYNIKDRGRKHNGQARAFNIPAIVRLINSPCVQERVQSGDMVGYLGHGIRQQFGLNPPEVTLSEGQVVPIEPAFTTCYLKANEDGTIEHQARFLDTPLGKTAQEWFNSKTGGFSSVVAPDERNPEEFYGFDYVRTPNFNGNRGYVLDSAADQEFYEFNRLTTKKKFELFQAVQLESQAVMDALTQSYSGLYGQLNAFETHQQTLQVTLDHMEQQIREKDQLLRDAQFELSRLEPKPEPMMRLNVGDSNWLEHSLTAFDSVETAKLVAKPEPDHSYTMQSLLRHLK